MMTRTQDEIRNYLLGNATQPNLEGQLLANDALFEELLVQEDEIIDEYVRWQTFFLAAPERKWSMRFAQVLNLYLMNHEPLGSE